MRFSFCLSWLDSFTHLLSAAGQLGSAAPGLATYSRDDGKTGPHVSHQTAGQLRLVQTEVSGFQEQQEGKLQRTSAFQVSFCVTFATYPIAQKKSRPRFKKWRNGSLFTGGAPKTHCRGMEVGRGQLVAICSLRLWI